MATFLIFVYSSLLPFFLISTVLLVISAIFFSRAKKLFYASLIVVATLVYFYILFNFMADGFDILPVRRVSIPFEDFWDGVWATCITAALYGFIGLLVSLVRRMLHLPTQRLFVYTLIAFMIGITGSVIFYLLPCEWSPKGCPWEDSIPDVPLKARGTDLVEPPSNTEF